LTRDELWDGGLVFRRTYEVLVLTLCLASGLEAATNLKVTDSRGTEVVVADAAIDYGGFLGAELEADGIRVLQGDGLVLLKWEDVESVTVVKRDESAKPIRVELQVSLKNGKTVSAALYRKGNMKLVGKSDLGAYSIELDKVRAIAPIK
jgi:hypothetical protein